MPTIDFTTDDLKLRALIARRALEISEVKPLPPIAEPTPDDATEEAALFAAAVAGLDASGTLKSALRDLRSAVITATVRDGQPLLVRGDQEIELDVDDQFGLAVLAALAAAARKLLRGLQRERAESANNV